MEGTIIMKKISLVLVVTLLLSLFGVLVGFADGQVFAFEKAEYSVLAGKSIKLRALAQGIPGRLKYEWTSSDDTIGKINNGQFKGISKGSSTVTCVATDTKGQTYTAKCIVNVLKPIESINVEEKEVEVAQSNIWAVRDASEELRAAFSHKPIITIEPLDASLQTLEWVSSKPDLVSVDENGVIKGINVGTAVVTGKAIDGSKKSVKIKVTVPGCYVTEDNITITTPDGALLGYMYASFSGISRLGYKLSGGVVEDGYTNKEDGEMRFIHLIPQKAGKGTITFTRNGKTLKTVKVQVEHSAVYDTVSYPPAQVGEIIDNPQAHFNKQMQIRCSVESITENRVIGATDSKGQKQYFAFDLLGDVNIEIGKTYVFYGTLRDTVDFKTETGLAYHCPLFTSVIAK
jgi:hypothetical protein